MRDEEGADLQKVILGIHRILGHVGRRHRYFKDITLQIKDNGNRKQIRSADWEE